MSGRISFFCPSCSARLRASTRFIGQSCPCPQCGTEVIVPPRALDDESPLLVLDDGFRRPRSPQRAGAHR
jgi:DNA-directed RNA polymerase subunit RPC12/RpoP